MNSSATIGNRLCSLCLPCDAMRAMLDSGSRHFHPIIHMSDTLIRMHAFLCATAGHANEMDGTKASHPELFCWRTVYAIQKRLDSHSNCARGSLYASIYLMVIAATMPLHSQNTSLQTFLFHSVQAQLNVTERPHRMMRILYICSR